MEYYLDQFYEHFFPEVDFDYLNLIYGEKLNKENEEIYISNMDEVINDIRDNQSLIIDDSFYDYQNNVVNRVIELSNININEASLELN